jgi:hypothetical protein
MPVFLKNVQKPGSSTKQYLENDHSRLRILPANLQDFSDEAETAFANSFILVEA